MAVPNGPSICVSAANITRRDTIGDEVLEVQMSSWDSVEVMSNQYSSTKSWRTVLVESRIGRALKVSLRVTLHFTRLQLPLLPLSPVTWLCPLCRF